MRFLLALVLIGCAHRGGGGGGSVTLRPACGDGERWNGAACVARTPATAAALAEGETALGEGDLERADAAVARAAAEPLDHESNVKLWELRGLAAAYRLYDEATAANVTATETAYRHLLALHPEHRLNCKLADKATSPFEDARAAAAVRGTPEIALTWSRTLRLGEPVPIEIETVADPDGLLHGATLYVRQRGTTAWRATDVPLSPPGEYTRVRLPAIEGTEPTALELYATASDRDGNETLMWATALRPREVPLRYDPPTPWYRTWWVWAIAGGVVATGAGVVTYALVWEPSSELDGGIIRR